MNINIMKPTRVVTPNNGIEDRTNNVETGVGTEPVVASSPIAGESMVTVVTPITKSADSAVIATKGSDANTATYGLGEEVTKLTDGVFQSIKKTTLRTVDFWASCMRALTTEMATKKVRN